MNWKIVNVTLLVCFLGLLSVAPVLGDDINASFNVSGTPPMASNCEINSDATIYLTAGTTTSVEGTVGIDDAQGYEDIVRVEGIFYRTSIGAGASNDNQNHYVVNCTSNGDGFGTSETYTCSYDITHYADPTDAGSAYAGEEWTFRVVPYDGSGAGSNESSTVEIATLTALSVDQTPFDFGSLNLNGDTGSTNEQTVLTNRGNEILDFQISGSNFSCTSGTASINYLKYSTSAFTYSSGGTATTTSNVEVDFDLARGSEGTTQPTQNLYFGLGLPSSGISGTCLGTISLTAVSDPTGD